MPLDLDNLFSYHPPKGDQIERYNRIRTAARVFAQAITDNTPESAEQTVAIRELQKATMMANAAIAINEP